MEDTILKDDDIVGSKKEMLRELQMGNHGRHGHSGLGLQSSAL